MRSKPVPSVDANTVDATPSAPRTFVLVHGAWHGAWCWKAVASLLRRDGHRVLTPTQTGLGERAHLLSRAITIDTFIDDITDLMSSEDLDDVVLVGHSFGGIAISGVADRMPQRLRQLIYLDALMLENGQGPFDTLSADLVAARIAAAQAFSGGLSLPPPDPSLFGVRDPDQCAWVASRMTPHPMSTYTSTLHLAHPVANGVPATYIVCTEPVYAPLEESRKWVRASGWPMEELVTGHDAMISAPETLAAMLLDIAR